MLTQKESIRQFLKSFKFKFKMEKDAIDLRAMAENYPNKIIPLEDVKKAISFFIPPNLQNIPPYDPSGGAQIVYPSNSTNPKFGYVEWEDFYLWPSFQRDVIPNHVSKIRKDFKHSCIIIPCAIKITIDGKPIYCLWDGHHTIQVCKLMNYTKFPIWYIDVDEIPSEEIKNAGFTPDNEGKIKYGVYLAGKNAVAINSLNKRQMSAYDVFKISLNTGDPVANSMHNILKKYNCVVRRKPDEPRAFTQIKAGEECYNLLDLSGVKGRYWERSLRFHTSIWPDAPIVLEIFRPMSYLYQMAEQQGFMLPDEFDLELGDKLANRWGTAEIVQKEIKESYRTEYALGKIRGIAPNNDKDLILNGIINFYIRSNGKQLLPPPTCQWII